MSDVVGTAKASRCDSGHGSLSFTIGEMTEVAEDDAEEVRLFPCKRAHPITGIIRSRAPFSKSGQDSVC